VQPVQDVRHRGAKTGSEFVRAAPAACLLLGFQHQDLAAGFRQEGGAHRAVMAAADDDRIPSGLIR
jgi:hypothetical protein